MMRVKPPHPLNRLYCKSFSDDIVMIWPVIIYSGLVHLLTLRLYTHTQSDLKNW